MKNRLNQPDVEMTTTITGESINLNVTIPSKQFTDIFATQTNIQEDKPTFEEVKKEWEEMNCEWLETDRHIFIHSKESFDGVTFPTIALLYKENKTYVSNYIFDIKTHKLLTETMKSLGWFDE